MRSCRKRHCRKIDSDNQFVGPQICVPLRCVSGQAVKIGNRNFTLAVRPSDTDDRVESSERDAHVARISCDAGFALAEDRVNSVVTFECATTASWIALVALREPRVIEIIAARSLQKIAAN